MEPKGLTTGPKFMIDYTGPFTTAVLWKVTQLLLASLFACFIVHSLVQMVSCEHDKIHTLYMFRAVIDIGYIL